MRRPPLTSTAGIKPPPHQRPGTFCESRETLGRLSSAFDRCASFLRLNAGFTGCCSKTMRRGRMNEESWRTIGFFGVVFPLLLFSCSKGTQLEWGIEQEEAVDGG